jgi:hypothetical protein
MDRLNEFPFASELTDELTLFLEIVHSFDVEVDGLERVVGELLSDHLPVEIEVGGESPGIFRDLDPEFCRR